MSHRRTGRLLGALASLAASTALLPATAAARQLTGGVVTVGRGAAGVALGMSRAQVLSKVGRPAYEDPYGFMQYVPDPAATAFDVEREGGDPSSSVNLISVAGGGFRLSDGNRVFAPGGLGRLSRRYGRRLRLFSGTDVGPYYEIVSRLGSRRVLTDFLVDAPNLRAKVTDIYIQYG